MTEIAKHLQIKKRTRDIVFDFIIKVSEDDRDGSQMVGHHVPELDSILLSMLLYVKDHHWKTDPFRKDIIIL